MWQLAGAVIVRTGTSSSVCTVVSLFSSVSFEIKSPDLNKLQTQTFKFFFMHPWSKLQHPKTKRSLQPLGFGRCVCPLS